MIAQLTSVHRPREQLLYGGRLRPMECLGLCVVTTPFSGGRGHSVPLLVACPRPELRSKVCGRLPNGRWQWPRLRFHQLADDSLSGHASEWFGAPILVSLASTEYPETS